jgi:AraC-like DNA-binding protein
MELRRLWRNASVEVLLSRWNRAQDQANRRGSTQSAVIEFMRTGNYCRRLPHGDVLIDANQVAFFNCFEGYEVSHPVGDCNSGLSLRVCPGFLETVPDGWPRRALSACGRRFVTATALSSPRCHLPQAQLVGVLCQGGTTDSIGAEELFLDLLQEALSAAVKTGQVEKPACSRSTSWRDRDRAEAVRRYLLAHWAERITLAVLAAQVECSYWHVASIFRARVGLPIHRYLKRLRLRHAVAQLQDGCTDLTRLALQCGFCSHSHFTVAFREEFGTTPSLVRSRVLLQE